MSYHVMLVGFRLEMTLGSLNEDNDVGESSDCVLQQVHKMLKTIEKTV